MKTESTRQLLDEKVGSAQDMKRRLHAAIAACNALWDRYHRGMDRVMRNHLADAKRSLTAARGRLQKGAGA